MLASKLLENVGRVTGADAHLRNLGQASVLTDHTCTPLPLCAITDPKKEEGMDTVNLSDHPIMITLQDTISGAGFLAQITLSGRTLLRKDDDGKWWMHGVRPAAITESGATIDEAFLRFRQAYKQYLFDVAQDSQDFSEFRTEVERFFNETDEDCQVWDNSLRAIRRCKGFAPPEPFSNLPRESPETRPARIEVERLDNQLKRFVPNDNVTDRYSVAIAA